MADSRLTSDAASGHVPTFLRTYLTRSLEPSTGVPLSAWLLGLAAILLTLGILRLLYVKRPLTRVGRSPHAWQPGVPVNLLPAHCDCCEGMLAPGLGLSCLICGRCAHRDHLKAADALPCKAVWDVGGVYVEGKYFPPHQLVKGNLDLNSMCAVCGDRAGIGQRLSDWRCLWCHLAVHAGCRSELSPVCTLGPLPDLVVDPRCVTASSRSRLANVSTSKFRFALDLPRFSSCRPLLCFINPKSGEGSQSSSLLLSSLCAALNPVQILDLSQHKPESLLRAFAPHLSKARILVCGGDGTISWILNTLDAMNLPEPPPIGLIPLGTGNDLARVLGWGGGYVNQPVPPILDAIATAEPVALDRWKVVSEHGRFRKEERYMVNYWSVGVDAAVTLGFHETRESNPELFRNRGVNKFIYVGGWRASSVSGKGC